LISPKEKLTLRIGESEFTYRRIQPAERENVFKRHTKKGQLNAQSATLEMIRLCVSGWKNVIGEDGQQIKFDPDLFELMPEMVLVKIEQAIISEFGEVEEAEKN
jgi:hypothetical protein